ncbi:MAG: hypothetical protein IKR11_02925 [Solobacterium sp.]|nr:hypothetical protein [Solobacterium sp.]
MSKYVLTTVIVGILGGILMAALLLYMMLVNGFRLFNIGFFLCLAAGIAFPLCLGLVEEDVMSVFMAQCILLAVSMLIIFFYAFVVSNSLAASGRENAVFELVLKYAFIIHGAALAVSLLVSLRKKKKD